jgi:hypothetical protein
MSIMDKPRVIGGRGGPVWAIREGERSRVSVLQHGGMTSGENEVYVITAGDSLRSRERRGGVSCSDGDLLGV